MSETIAVSEAVRVPAHAITVHAVRASGPGGQHVNKVSSKVELRVDVAAIEGLTDAARARLRTLAGRRLDAHGQLRVTSQASRSQARNVDDAREKVRRLVAAAAVRPRARLPTRAPSAAEERRLDVKRRRATLKRWRARPPAGD
jgi:ribosome-associated protein